MLFVVNEASLRVHSLKLISLLALVSQEIRHILEIQVT